MHSMIEIGTCVRRSKCKPIVWFAFGSDPSLVGTSKEVDIRYERDLPLVCNSVFVPPLPANLPELRDRIINAITAIDMDTLHRVWDELDYRLDVCRVTRGAHIEHL
ncbi:hypothetical protein ANN_27024 [Periplaneta americana]|uniref:Uncharacterized protein n=1 Tax=Periplaneta americana TaxID=6978 RepID=A0ABQ8RX05_PERAM|nr:hypothetical protein ANN_27024 [Periplaneta americana]